MRVTTYAKVLCVCVAAVSTHLYAANATSTQTSTTQVGSRGTSPQQGGQSQAANTQVTAAEQLKSQFWGLSIDEVRRADLLMKGPRGAFSSPQITPVEVLGIHARDEAERQKYAELFARILRSDTERVLAWSTAHAQAMAKLYPNDPVIDFSKSNTRPVVDPSVAEAAFVPKSAITVPERRTNQKSKPQPQKR